MTHTGSNGLKIETLNFFNYIFGTENLNGTSKDKMDKKYNWIIYEQLRSIRTKAKLIPLASSR